MTIEAESKFPVRDFSGVESQLRLLGTRMTPWYFEQNQVFDLPGNDLRARGMLLRLRKALTTTLTVKHPVDGRSDIPGIKQLEELECSVYDREAMTSILQALGYVEILQYEKFRAKWTLGPCTVCLDRLCFGKFVEIEGKGTDIFHAASLVGLDPQTAIQSNYHTLFHEYLAQQGRPAGDSFVFTHQERTTLCHKLDIQTP